MNELITLWHFLVLFDKIKQSSVQKEEQPGVQVQPDNSVRKLFLSVTDAMAKENRAVKDSMVVIISI
jgi:hypothetical protein